MRRALALFLLLVFSFPLIAPALLADALSNLPECCRRGGKHHCAMGLDDGESGQGSAFRSTQPKCPCYPGALATPMGEYAATLKSSVAIPGALVSHPAIQVQTEAGYRISLGRSAQKRGPPLLS
jgi:hypothetical protein